MKLSLNLLRQFLDFDLKSITDDELLKRVGEQLAGVEEVIDWRPRFDGVIVAEVMECASHPNADKLNVCQINVGKKELVQVVCGAPNVKKGLLVAWIPPGKIVPSTYREEPFVLEVRELRGVKSHGMLASPKELGISEDHEGVLEINAKDSGRQPKPGDNFSDYFGVDDLILDLENKMFTHRPDCFGDLGLARELAGIFGKKFSSPEWYQRTPRFGVADRLPLITKINTGKVLRFMAAAMDGIQVSPSPYWLQSALMRVGIKPINNVVDATNYVMHLTGQPIHAFDYDKLKARSGGGVHLGPRQAKKGEKLVIIGGKQLTLDTEDIVIATDKKAVALAGIMGGRDTEVDENTKRIVLECATFDMYSIRRSTMRHGLFTEAATRYTKGQSPHQNDRALWLVMKNITDLAGGCQASAVKDEHGVLERLQTVKTSTEFINNRLGSNLKTAEIVKILENVEFSVISNGDDLRVSVPFWRTDIEIPEDIVEEVGRLHGYHNLPIRLPARTSSPTERNEALDFRQKLRERLSSAGANEVLTYSFIHGELLKKTGVDPDKWAYHIRNAISPDLQYYRTSLMPSLLDKVHANIRSDMVRSDDNEFAIFEIGKVHVKGHDDQEKLPAEMERVALVFAADQKTAERKYHGSPFYMAKAYLELLTRGQVSYKKLASNEFPITSLYDTNRSAQVEINGQVFGVIGEIKPSIKKTLKLPNYVAGFELDYKLLKELIPESNDYRVLSNFPKSQQDITFKVSNDAEVGSLLDLINNELSQEGSEYNSVVMIRNIYQADKDSKHKNVTFRLWVNHPSKTLKTEEVNKILNMLSVKANEKYKAICI